MDFSLTPEHEMTRQMVREFAEREVAPTIKECNRAHRINLDALPRMAELGILGIYIPTCYGGAGEVPVENRLGEEGEGFKMMIPDQRGHVLREKPAMYEVDT